MFGGELLLKLTFMETEIKEKIEGSFYCRICGYDMGEEPWEVGFPDYYPNCFICACCGAESGYQDYTFESTLEYRYEWIAKGCPWFEPRERPTDWDYREQLKNIGVYIG